VKEHTHRLKLDSLDALRVFTECFNDEMSQS